VTRADWEKNKTGCMNVDAEIFIVPTRSHSANSDVYGLLVERDREDALAEDQTDRLFQQDDVEDRTNGVPFE
jgi:hypothetical protein